MAVTAKFVPDRVDLLPNTPSTLTLRLYNDGDRRDVTLTATGDLAEHVSLDSSAATVDTNQIVDVLVTVFAPATVPAGSYALGVEATVGSGQASPQQASLGVVIPAGDSEEIPGPPPPPLTGPEIVVATATIEIGSYSDHTLALQPVRSGGAKRGRHSLRVANTGNEVVTIDLSHDPIEDVRIDLEPPSLTVAPGLTGEVTVRITPNTTYWSGPRRDHEFTVQATGSNGRSDELSGVYQQRPRLPNGLGPAAAGAFAALLLGAIAWFTLLQPWVEETADNAAADAIEDDRAALRDRIDELEAAAAEAEELPLGQPTDLRLEVAPAGGNIEQDTAVIEPGTIVSITDVVFQNPTGAVGTVSLRRGNGVILQSELANFRDFDLHFVAPIQFDDDVEIVLEVECRSPGAGQSVCPVGASLVGFVDEVG